MSTISFRRVSSRFFLCSLTFAALVGVRRYKTKVDPWLLGFKITITRLLMSELATSIQHFCYSPRLLLLVFTLWNYSIALLFTRTSSANSSILEKRKWRNNHQQCWRTCSFCSPVAKGSPAHTQSNEKLHLLGHWSLFHWFYKRSNKFYFRSKSRQISIFGN